MRDSTIEMNQSKPPIAMCLTMACALFLFSTTNTHGQVWRPSDPVPGWSLTQFTTDNGLAQNSVAAMVQTRDGYIWLGTFGGLVRFDGIRFTTFNLATTPALRSNRILSLFESESGDLWTGTTHGGVTRFRNGEFTAYDETVGAPRGPVRTIAQDNDGAIWFAGRDLVRLANGAFENIGAKVGMPTTSAAWSVRFGADATTWVATAEGLGRIVDGSWIPVIHDIPNASPDSQFIGEFPDGGLWASGPNWLACVDHGTPFERNCKESIGGVFAAIRDRGGNYWIGSKLGVFRYLGKKEDQGAPCTIALESFFPSDFLNRVGEVRSLLEDREGNFWVGTDGNGLFRLRQREFSLLPLPDGITGVQTRAIEDDETGGVWLRTFDKIFRYENGQYMPASVAQDIPRISSVKSAHGGGLWIAHEKSRLSRVHGEEIKTFNHDLGAIRDLAEDQAGSVWISSPTGLSRFGGGGFQTVASAQDLWTSELPGPLFVASNGTVWISGGRSLSAYHHGSPKTGLSEALDLGADIRSFHESGDGSLWVTTYGAGLVRLHDGKIARFTAARGLPDDSLGKVLQDDVGNLWINSNHGVFRVSLAELNQRAEDASTLENVRILQTGESHGSHGVRTPDGRLWFSTLSGVVIIDPNKAAPSTAPPGPVVEQVVFDNKFMDHRTNIAAPPGDGRLEIRYTAPGYVTPDQIRFRYRLDGFDTQWVDAGTIREAVYTNLPPGNYQFRLRACNIDGLWSEDRTVLDIAFAPHFYQTQWFAGLSILFIITVALSAHSLRTHRMRERNVRLQRQKEALETLNTQLSEARIAADSASQAKTDFLSNMSHEIRTPMTAILGYTDILLGELDFTVATPSHIDHLRTIRRNGGHLLTILNDILDLSKIEAGKIQVENMSCRPVELVADVCRLMNIRSAEKKIRLDFEFDGLIPQAIQTDPTRLRQILLNMIGNAIKFTNAGGVRVVVSFTEQTEPPSMLFDVIDTGIGMSAEDMKGLFEPFQQGDSSTTRRFGGTGLGLTISKRLAGILGGELVLVHTQPGIGSRFRLTIACGELDGVPMVAASATSSKPPCQSTKDQPADQKIEARVLLAEDSDDNQHLISHFLKKAGATLVLAENGQLAVDVVRTSEASGMPFDAILMDMQMPVMDGYAATRAIRNAGYRGPIIALTAHAMPQDRDRCLEAGCDEYLTKPIDRARLIRVINSMLAEKSTKAAVSVS